MNGCPQLPLNAYGFRGYYRSSTAYAETQWAEMNPT
jgi:hypothetical protein